ncbi:MAG TPA: hypothetical protein VGK32_15220 [Vicinamibacterales bacterium]
MDTQFRVEIVLDRRSAQNGSDGRRDSVRAEGDADRLHPAGRRGDADARLPGQPDRELVSAQGTTFDVKGLPGVSIEFKRRTTIAKRKR